MENKDRYEEIRVNQIGRQNIDIVKKFFSFQPKDLPNGQGSFLEQVDSKNFSNIKMTTKNLKVPIGVAKYAIRKKTQLSYNTTQGVKYSIGFLEKSQNQNQRQYEQSPLKQTKIILQSKRIHNNQLTSFLLGINSRINKQHKSRFTVRFQDQSQTNDSVNGELIPTKYDSANLYKTSPAKSSTTKYKQIMDKVCSIKQKSFVDSSINKIAEIGYKFQLNTSNSPLPKLNNKKERSAIFTDKISEPQFKISQDFMPQKECQISDRNKRQNNGNQIKYINNQQIRSVSPRKLQKPQRIFQKGYLYYDTQASSFYNKYGQKLQKQPVFTKQMTGITAKSYFVLNGDNLTPIAGRNHKNQSPIQIASLTKIMTCYLCIIACKKYDINLDEYTIRVSDKAAQMAGTSAQLQTGDILTLKQLLYGLMLPSGNDASVVIAQAVGRIIQKYKKKPTRKTPYQTFIVHMNIMARQLKIQQSYQNPSGLASNPNYSTPQAITVLSAIASKNEFFNRVVNTKQYELEIKNQRFGLVRKQIWRNTNKLLWKDWSGIKTGTTEVAGHCLIAKKKEYIIAVFDCQTLSKRFSECLKIYEFLVEQGNCKNQQNFDKELLKQKESQQNFKQKRLINKIKDTSQQYKTL